VRARRAIPEIGVTVLTLSNGVEVWLKPTDFKADEVLLSSYAFGGLSAVDSTDYVSGAFASSVVGTLGVGGFTATELQKLLSGRIASASPSHGWYTHGVSGSARPADLETMLQLLHLTFTRPTEDRDGFRAMRTRLRALYEDRLNSPEQVFSDTVNAINSGRLWMTRPLAPEDIDRLDLGRALALHRRRFGNAADFTFFVAGAFDPQAVEPLLARYLGSLPSKGRRQSAYRPIGPRYPWGVSSAVVRKGTEPKAGTRITMFSAPKVDELDQHRARAVAGILTDHLRESLRELLGGTYSAGASLSALAPLDGYATVSIAFGCAPGRVDTMVATALAEARRMIDPGPSADDVRRQQEVERRELEVALKTNGFWTGALMTVHQNRWDPLRLTKRRERIDLLTPELLRETARRYLALDRRTVITLLPETGAGAPAGAGPGR
jgi:zinc protease